MTATIAPPISEATERLQRAVHLLLHAMGYAPRQTWAVGEFLFVAMRTEEKAADLLKTLGLVSWVREAELRLEDDGSPYIRVRYQR